MNAVILGLVLMPFLRPLEYYENRFYEKQEEAYVAFKAGHNLHLPWGRRAGKSDLMAEIFIEDIEEHGRDCLYIALTQGQAFEIFWPKLESRLRGLKNWKPNYARHEFRHLPSGAVIAMKGADLGKHRLRGSAKRVVGLDEFAFYRDPSIVKDVIVPMLADYNGQLIYASSPNGENHFYDLEREAKAGKKRLYSIKATMFDNPFISPAGREMLLSEYTGLDDPLYRQEVLGEYVVLEGMAFALPQDSYKCNLWDKADFDHSYHWRGVDHGFNPDPTAAVWLAYNRRKGHWIVYNEYKKAKQLIQQHADVINGLEDYSFLDTISDVDPQIIAEYGEVGLSMTPAHKFDKNARILRIVNALKTGKLKIAKNCTQLLEEIKTYIWEQDGNDHLIDSLIYAFTNATVPEEVVEQRHDPFEDRVRYSQERSEGQDFG